MCRGPVDGGDSLNSEPKRFRSYPSIVFLGDYYYCYFLKPALADGFSLSLNDRKSPELSGTILSIQADLNNLDGLCSFFHFRHFQHRYQPFGGSFRGN